MTKLKLLKAQDFPKILCFLFEYIYENYIPLSCVKNLISTKYKRSNC